MSGSRWTAEQWRDVVEQQRQSSQRVPAFCTEHGLKPSTFFAWRRRLRDEAKADGGAFIELTPRVQETPVHASGIEVALPRGVTVRVGDGFDAGLLRRVVEALS